METLYDFLKDSQHDLEIVVVDFPMDFRVKWVETILSISCKNCGWFANNPLPETLVGKGDK